MEIWDGMTIWTVYTNEGLLSIWTDRAKARECAEANKGVLRICAVEVRNEGQRVSIIEEE